LLYGACCGINFLFKFLGFLPSKLEVLSAVATLSMIYEVQSHKGKKWGAYLATKLLEFI